MKISTLMTLMAFAIVAAPAVADEKSDDPSKKKTRKEHRVETKVFGKKISIGPDGKVEIADFGQGAHQIPEEIRKKIEQAMESVKGKSGSISLQVSTESEEDSVSDSGEADAEVTVTSSGSVTIVGPDGKKQTFNFGDGDIAAQTSKAVEKMLNENANVSEMLRKRVRDMLQRRGPDGLGGIDIRHAMRNNPPRNDSMKQLDKKLDAIISRLDQLEADVNELKDK